MIGGRPPIDLDLGSVFEAARETSTALEINGALPRLDPPLDALRQARDVAFLLTSDAHQTSELQLVEFAALHAQRAQLPLSQVKNGQDGEQLRAWLTS
jgi:DNA polymerase (family 10)